MASLHYRSGQSAGTNFRWEIHGTEGDVVVTEDTGNLQYGFVEVRVWDSRGDGAVEHEVVLCTSLAGKTTWSRLTRSAGRPGRMRG